MPQSEGQASSHGFSNGIAKHKRLDRGDEELEGGDGGG